MKVFSAIFLYFLASNLLAQNSDLNAQFEYYKSLNSTEKRLIEFADNDSDLYLKVVQLQVINESRLKFRCSPVLLDILACRVANKMAKDAAEGNYVGHWNRAGEKPYHRWAFAGGKDHVAENAYGEWSSAKYAKNHFTIDSLMKAGHKAFITEKHPNDGHKQNIIYKPHTHVGLGFFLVDRHFTYYEEFLDRYYSFENELKPSYTTNEKIELIVRCDSSIGLTKFYACKENKIKPMNPVKITLKGSYFDGTSKITFFDLPKPQADGTYHLEFGFKKKGLYYLQIFHRPFDEKGRLIGKEVQASGLMIWVE